MEQQTENVLPSTNAMTPPTVPGVPLPFIPQMPPLGPAPVQLPPLVHPPPAPPTTAVVPNQSIAEPQVEPVVPIQTQFETLNLNSPSEPVNNESNTLPPPLPPLPDGVPLVPPPFNTNGESSLVPEENKPGRYLTISCMIIEMHFFFSRSIEYHRAKYVDT